MFDPIFSVNQVIGSPQSIVVNDISTGTDSGIISRRLSILNAYGDYMVPTGNSDPRWISWGLVNPSITVTIPFSQDYATFIVVQWLDVSGNVLYSSQDLTDQTLYGEQLAFKLCQMLAGNPNIAKDTNFLMNSFQLRLLIDNSECAVSIGNNIYDAQTNLNIEQGLITDQNLYF